MKKYLEKLLLFFSFITLVFWGSFLKISFGLGSYKFIFSGINLIFPLFGSFFSIFSSILIVPLLFIFKKLTLGGVITLGIPTLVATLNWSRLLNSNNNKFIIKNIFEFFLRVILPLICIILFCLHPVGQKAFIYSFYWFIPIIIYFVQKIKQYNSIFLIALTSTFLAHSVGSIIWLYTVSITSQMWNALIPIVAIERLVFACGMSLIYLGFKKILKISIMFLSKVHVNVLKN